MKRKKGQYAKDSINGRSYPTKHHLIAKRFYNKKRKKIFETIDKPSVVELCYDCHEELLHNPVLSANDIEKFSMLIKQKECNETIKDDSKNKIRERIDLFAEIIAEGIKTLLIV